MKGKRNAACAQQDFFAPKAPFPEQGGPPQDLAYLFVRGSHIPHLTSLFE